MAVRLMNPLLKASMSLSKLVAEDVQSMFWFSTLFEVRVGLAVPTTGPEAGQLLNMLFGNTSLHEDVTLHDVVFPQELIQAFGGPRHGLHELRRRVGAPRRCGPAASRCARRRGRLPRSCHARAPRAHTRGCLRRRAR